MDGAGVTPLIDGGKSSFDQAVKSAAGSSVGADPRIADMQKSMRADSDRLERAAEEKAKANATDIASMPAFDDKPPAGPAFTPPPAPPQPDPFKAFGSVAAALGALGGLLTKRPLMAGLNAAAGAMKAQRANDIEAYRENYKAWQDQSQHAIKTAEFQQQAYQDIIENKKLSIDEINRRIQARAAAFNDDVTLHMTRSGDARDVITHLDKMKELTTSTKLAYDRLKIEGDEKEREFGIQERRIDLQDRTTQARQAFEDRRLALQTQAQQATIEHQNRADSINAQRYADEAERAKATAAENQRYHDILAKHNEELLHATTEYHDKQVELAKDRNKLLQEKSNASAGRIQVFNGRMLLSANEATRDLENVSKLSTTASTGVLGNVGGGGHSLMDAGRSALANSLTPQEAQSYNVMATGFQRSLAAIEASGLASQSGLSEQMGSVLLKPGDTNLTKLMKMAQVRQIVDAGLEFMETSPATTPDQLKMISTLRDRLQGAVPYTQSDLIKLQYAQQGNPRMTLRQYAAENGLGDIPSVKSDADFDKLAPGAQFYDPQGNLRRKPAAEQK